MKESLSIKNFRLIVINKEEKSSYYSFKVKGWEITIDYDYCIGWQVYLCNKWEEVVEEYPCGCEDEAMEIANKIYKSFPIVQFN